MIGPRVYRRPVSGLPAWAAAILTVAAILLMINALPMLAEAITPEHSHSGSSADAPDLPTPLPLTPGQGAKRADAGGSSGAQVRDVPSKGGDLTSGSSASSDPSSPGARARGPLPVSGDSSLAPLLIGGGLLGGGLGLLTVVGFSGGRPWPGRYVRRDA
ncbi:MAG TPA: hypothetical protein VMZ00_08180 [Sporichthya sp.]|nr:hypothetical protein [Sporichthya sp.]